MGECTEVEFIGGVSDKIKTEIDRRINSSDYLGTFFGDVRILSYVYPMLIGGAGLMIGARIKESNEPIININIGEIDTNDIDTAVKDAFLSLSKYMGRFSEDLERLAND